MLCDTLCGCRCQMLLACACVCVCTCWQVHGHKAALGYIPHASCSKHSLKVVDVNMQAEGLCKAGYTEASMWFSLTYMSSQVSSRYTKAVGAASDQLVPMVCHGFSVQAFTNYTILVNHGLVNQVLYRVWLIAKDSLGNRQTALSSVTVMTVRTTPPSFQQLLVQYNAPTSVYIEVSCNTTVNCNCTYPWGWHSATKTIAVCYTKRASMHSLSGNMEDITTHVCKAPCCASANSP